MKNRLIFRILGAISSALIIASVFVPYVSVTGFSQSLWQSHSTVGTLYLPIMIIVFGTIGVLCFSANIKTELAYASSGALLFFLVTQTIPIIDQGTFNTMSIGYYCLCIGTILIGVMAFLCNLKIKAKKTELPVVEEKKEESMINQIDRLYNNEHSLNPGQESKELDNIIQPLQPLQPLNTTPLEVTTLPPIPESNSSIPITPLPTNNSVLENNVDPLTSLNSNSVQPMDQTVNQIPVHTNPVISEFEVTQLNTQPIDVATSEPVVQQPVEIINTSASQPLQPLENNTEDNPVLAEFNNSAQQTSILSQAIVEPTSALQEELPQQTLQPLNGGVQTDAVNNSNQSTNAGSNLDIFG